MRTLQNVIKRRSYPHVIMYKLRRLLKNSNILMESECIHFDSGPNGSPVSAERSAKSDYSLG